eukprot:4336295-Amphidinium_carterae.2
MASKERHRHTNEPGHTASGTAVQDALDRHAVGATPKSKEHHGDNNKQAHTTPIDQRPFDKQMWQHATPAHTSEEKHAHYQSGCNPRAHSEALHCCGHTLE